VIGTTASSFTGSPDCRRSLRCKAEELRRRLPRRSEVKWTSDTQGTSRLSRFGSGFCSGSFGEVPGVFARAGLGGLDAQLPQLI